MRYGCKEYVYIYFRRLRERFQVDPADYMLPVCGSDVLREFSSPRKSGRCFYLTQDDRFMIKTVRKSEVKVGCHPFDFCFVNQKSIFPKNFKFKKEELVRLWMAEDLLLHPKGENLEEVGTEYFVEVGSCGLNFYKPKLTIPT